MIITKKVYKMLIVSFTLCLIIIFLNYYGLTLFLLELQIGNLMGAVIIYIFTLLINAGVLLYAVITIKRGEKNENTANVI